MHRWRLGAMTAWVALVFCGCPSSGGVSNSVGVTDHVSPEVTQPLFDVGPRDSASIADSGRGNVANGDFEVTEADEVRLPECGGPSCPTAVVKSYPAGVVVPGTVLQFQGSGFSGPCGGVEIVGFEWDVEKPPGSQSEFVPSAVVADPSFLLDAPGSYKFLFYVFDDLGTPSCSPALLSVDVTDAPALTVQLLWYTPGDPDETDEGLEAGADLDLHLLHPLAAGPDLDGDGSPEGWFHIPWDCFWCNPSPDWGPEGPDGNPYHPVEDIDGLGPETILFAPAEPGLYKIGVHYWDDHGYGPSFATVQVYIWDTLAFEFPDVKLEEYEMWEVATVEFPSGKISTILDEEGQPRITPPWYSGYLLCPQQ